MSPEATSLLHNSNYNRHIGDMARRTSSFGFLGRFGRSEDLRQLDAALRGADLHPALVPEGLKLAISNLMKDHAGDVDPPKHAYLFTASLFAYCVLGPEHFAAANGEAAAADVATRIEAAIENDESFDAALILLAMHSRLIRPEVVDRFGLEIG